MARGRTLVTSTSAVSARRSSACAPPGALRSIATERLPRLALRNTGPMPGFLSGPIWRVTSPSGASILITSAPISPRIWVA